ncbi:MAG: NADH-quinone oxidoreductase subunit M [Deltaproteobacteria bacterium]|nr:NADH-quinone oxidoreductase subunit M [Deltaproteobacteria bacterium]
MRALALLDAHLLTIITFLPVGVGLLLLALRGLSPRAVSVIGFAGSLATFVLSLRLFALFDPVREGFQLVERHPWFVDYGVHYFVGIDGISLLLIVMTTFLVPVALLSAWNAIRERTTSFVFFMLFLETAMVGTFAALNLFQFYVFWELMLVPMMFLIGIWGAERRIYAAVKFFLYTVVGSLFMLVAVLSVYYLYFQQFGTLNFDLVAGPGGPAHGLLDTVVPISGEAPWWQTQVWLFAAFALAFGIKVPIVPLHTWLPDAHVEAPTAGSVILAGVLLKMGTYGFVRLALPLFPAAAVELAPVFFGLGLAGILYGALVAMVQDDMKKLVAYSSVAHLGFVMLGMFTFNREGLEGSVLQMVNHGLSSGALFLLVGVVYERRHTHLIAEFSGLSKPMPVYAALFVIVAMSSIGLPLLNGFVGEFLILIGTFLVSPAVATAATFGVVLAAMYMLWMLRRVLFGPVERAENRGLLDLGLRERIVMMAMIVPIVWIGVHPQPLLRRLDTSTSALLRRVEAGVARASAVASARAVADAFGEEKP